MEKIKEWLSVLDSLPPAVGTAVKVIIILFIGWIIAKIIAKIVEAIFSKTDIDEKVAKLLGVESANTGKAFGKFIFLLVMLFVVIAALTAAGQDEITESLNGIVKSFTEFFPNLLGAGILAFVTWILVKVVSGVLGGLLSASRVDERLGLGEDKPIQNSIVLIVSSLIILVMLREIVSKLDFSSVSAAVNPLLEDVFNYIPKIVAAVVILGIGILISKIVGKVLAAVLSSIGFDRMAGSLGKNGEISIAGRSASEGIALVVSISIIVMMSAQALDVLKLDVLGGLSDLLINVWTALLILGIGFLIADFAQRALEGRSAFWAKVAHIGILVFVAGMALQRANLTDLSDDIIQNVMFAAIIAAAVAFGVGGAMAIGVGAQDWVRRRLDK